MLSVSLALMYCAICYCGAATGQWTTQRWRSSSETTSVKTVGARLHWRMLFHSLASRSSTMLPLSFCSEVPSKMQLRWVKVLLEPLCHFILTFHILREFRILKIVYKCKHSSSFSTIWFFVAILLHIFYLLISVLCGKWHFQFSVDSELPLWILRQVSLQLLSSYTD